MLPRSQPRIILSTVLRHFSTKMSLPTESKAVVQPDPSSTKLESTTLPIPKATESEHLIYVYGTSPCLGELGWEKNFPALFKERKARVPGTEGAGVIAKAPGGSPYKPGDAVMWRNNAWMWGSLRGVTAILEENIAPKPECLSWSEAAATPLSTLTAWDGVFTHGPLDPAALEGDSAARKKNEGYRILITGASGGVGGWAVRLAAAAGAHVIGFGGGAAADGCKKDGAEAYLDYKQDDLAQLPEKVDHIFDCTGRDTEKGWSVLRDNGSFVSVW